MDLYLAILYCIAGIFLLFWCGNRLVDGSVFWAKELGVSTLFIGVAIIGFGTSLPEMIATASAVRMDSSELALGNITGSNIANIGLVLGLALILAKKVKPTKSQLREYSFMMLAMFLFTMVMMKQGEISTVSGVVFLLALCAYLYFALENGKASGAKAAEEAMEEEVDLPDSKLKASLFLAIGFAGLFAGAELTINGAVTIAESFGVSERIIGLTLVAIGTSLPEIAATIAAARHGSIALTLGNVAGSNIFNVLGAGGVGALVGTMRGSTILIEDMMVMIGFGFVVAYLFLMEKPKSRSQVVVILALDQLISIFLV